MYYPDITNIYVGNSIYYVFGIANLILINLINMIAAELYTVSTTTDSSTHCSHGLI